MNRLFVAYKNAELSSNAFLSLIKKKYKVKKAGYSGTLDPFAKGVLIVAFGQFTKLFRFLKKSPKIYRTTLWFGANSLSFDNKNIQSIAKIPMFDLNKLEKIKNELLGEITFTPPQFSAKRIQGKRAYEFAKKGETIALKECKMQIFSCEILHYTHPFLNLELCVSEGAYVRSYCELFAQKLGISATLSALERIKEGEFSYEFEKSLDVLKYLDLKENFLKDLNKLENGSKIDIKELRFQDEGNYYIKDKNFFCVINIKDNKVKYILNKVERC